MRWSFVLLPLLAACGSDAIDDIFIGDGGVVPRDATLADGDSSFDAGVEATPFNGGGPFLCGDCICDGTLDFCGGAVPNPDASDGSACVPDAGPCRPIPIECLPKPTCECILAHSGECLCAVDPSGNGLDVVCINHDPVHGVKIAAHCM